MNSTTAEAEPQNIQAPVAPPPPELSFKEKLFQFFERFGHLMSRILLTILYVILVAPAGIILALFGDPLRIRKYRGTSWMNWTHENNTTEQARRQD